VHHGITDEKAGSGSDGHGGSARHSAVPARPAGGSLQPVSAQAFDPYGQGENGQPAPLAADGNLATAWQTEWT
jgi:hypothetical protein